MIRLSAKDSFGRKMYLVKARDNPAERSYSTYIGVRRTEKLSVIVRADRGGDEPLPRSSRQPKRIRGQPTLEFAAAALLSSCVVAKRQVATVIEHPPANT